jgi:hypothetical protein
MRGVEGAPRVKCICPRALARIEELKSMRAKRDAQRAPRTQPAAPVGRPPVGEARQSEPTYLRNMQKGIVAPDLSAGACRTPGGMATMDAAATNRWAGKPLRAAKALCAVCVVSGDCYMWAALGEKPAGAWIGMYGGETHIERKKRAKQETEGRVA